MEIKAWYRLSYVFVLFIASILVNPAEVVGAEFDYGNNETQNDLGSLVQFTEHKIYKDIDVMISFARSSGKGLKISSSAESAGRGYVFFVVPASLIDGKYIRWQWEGSVNSREPVIVARAFIMDGAYDIRNSTDFPVGNNITIKGKGILQVLHEERVAGKWGPVIVEKKVDIEPSSEYVTVFFELVDDWGLNKSSERGLFGWLRRAFWRDMKTVTLYIKFIEINEGPNGEGNVVRLELDKGVINRDSNIRDIERGFIIGRDRIKPQPQPIRPPEYQPQPPVKEPPVRQPEPQPQPEPPVIPPEDVIMPQPPIKEPPLPQPQPQPPIKEPQPLPEMFGKEVVMEGFICAVVTDYVDRRSSETEYYLCLSDGRYIPIDISKVRVPLEYVGNPDRQVKVRGYWVLKIVEIIEQQNATTVVLKNESSKNITTLEGFIGAVVTDYIYNRSKSKYVLFTKDYRKIVIDLSNATIKLKEPLPVYIGNPDRIVIVNGYFDGDIFIVTEIYDSPSLIDNTYRVPEICREELLREGRVLPGCEPWLV